MFIHGMDGGDVKNKAAFIEDDGGRIRIVHLDRIKRARRDAIAESS